MNNNNKRLFFKMIFLFLAVVIIVMIKHLTAYADTEADDPMILVSLGDSYSSGEGIEPFYGQDDSAYKYKTDKNDWLAHRSVKSWPSKLVIPGYEGASGSNTMGDYWYNLAVPANKSGHSFQSLQNNCVWYFVASSGATSANIKSEEQVKTIRQSGINNHLKYNKKLPTQLSVFEKINGTVDYVTLTIGGNDVDFSKIITTCATRSTYLGSKKLEKDIDKLWENFENTKKDLKQAYLDIAEAAPNANIIVADYPQLLDQSGKGIPISKKEAELVDSNVSLFNDELEKLVEECNSKGMKIYFVDVEKKFLGHEAYSDNPWINKIRLGAAPQDLDDRAVASSYSMHPNEKGAEAYAECVNEMIRKISVEAQLKVISDNYSQWNIIDTGLAPRSGYTITDINNNGRVEIIVSSTTGTGIFSQTHIFEVNEDISGLVECSFDNEYSPDIVFMESADVYLVDDNYKITCYDAAQNGWQEQYVINQAFSLQETDIIVETIGSRLRVTRTDGVSNDSYFDRKKNTISETEYNRIIENAFPGYPKGEIIFKWIELGSKHSNDFEQLRKSWYGFSCSLF